MDALIKRSMGQATHKFYDAFAHEISVMIYQGYQDNILHNPRLVMYKLLGTTMDGITVTKKFEKKISGVINVLKYRGIIQNFMTIDTTRTIHNYNSFNDKQHGLNSLANGFYLDRWETQPGQLLLMCEASGYLGVIKHIADEFRVPYVPAKGDMSVQLKMEIAELIKEKPTTILYYGDYDTKGLQIPKTIEGDLRALSPEADLTFKRMFINEDDICTYDLAVDAKGNVQMEQLDTDVAINKSIDFINGIIDQGLWDETIQLENKYRDEIKEIS